MAHVSGNAPKYKGCLFEPPGETRQDKELLLLYRNRETIVLLNRFPYANGHLLVAPIRHVSCISELDEAENNGLSSMVRQCARILRAHFQPDGLNIGYNIGEAAGAGIADHLHVHIIPRWNGDHNFMTVVSEIRTIPEHIEHTFDALSPLFNAL